MTVKLPSPDENRAEEAAVLALLEAPSTYPEDVGPIETIETHAARVILAGRRAYKVKKRIRLPFLDFTTEPARHRDLGRELELNQPHAPGIYLRLLPITREADGTLALGGTGTAIDWALEMQRFDQGDVLVEVAARAPLSVPLCQVLAEMVARYHETSPAAYKVDAPGLVEATLMPLLAQLKEASGVLDPERVAAVKSATRAGLARISPLLTARGLAGSVRRCHGDLHLGNIVLIDGHPVPFDALEFDETMATTDVLYDLAFLLMDLVKRDDRNAANLIFNAYLGRAPLGNELEGLATLPLFLAMRALVRAVVALARARQPGADRAMEQASAARLVELASSFIAPPRCSLVAVGGFSGTGKTTLARALASHIGPAPGAVHLRTDVERKHLFGIPETEKLSPDHYSQAVSDEVYRLTLNKAARALAAGHSVIADAVFAKPDERSTLEQVAKEAGCPFVGLWLEAPADTLIERVEARQSDASDADAKVVTAQLAYRTGRISWTRINARGAAEKTLTDALATLAPHGLLSTR